MRVARLLLGSSTLLALAQRGEGAPIQDNSFLVEEANNQEAGVAQHIAMRRSTSS